MRLLVLLVVVGLCRAAATERITAEPLAPELPWNASVTVDLEARKEISKVLFGIFFEEVRLSAIPPLMLKTEANPAGTPIEAFDQLRSAIQADRSQFWKDLSLPFYGYNRLDAKISEGVREAFLGAMGKSTPRMADMPVIALSTAVEEDLPEKEGVISVPWPCETKVLVDRIEAALLDLPASSTTRARTG